VRKGEAEDGRILIAAVGRKRIKVTQWLEDAPYPRALVEDLGEAEEPEGLAVAIAAASVARRRLLALAIEMGADGQQLDLELPDEPLRAAWALCAAAPAGSYDRQRLLEVDDAVQRLQLLELIMADQARDLEDALRRS
jgi:Lon protease-like protein